MKRKETSVSSEEWICSHQQPGADALWDYPNSLPHGCVGFHQASLLATLHLHTVSLLLHASYWSLNSLRFSRSHLLWSFSNLLHHAHGLSNPEKESCRRRGASSAVFSTALLLRGWEGPTTLLSVMSLLRDADAVSTFLLVSLAPSHKGRLKELNTCGLATRSLRKAMIMLSSIWST